MSVTNVYKTVNLSRDEWLVYFAALDTRIDFLKARIEADPDYFAWREQLATAEKMFAELHDVPAHGQHAAATIADFYAK